MIEKILKSAKPILTRVIPISVLRKARQKLERQRVLGTMKQLPTSFKPEMHPKGINLIGGILGNSGLAQSSRLVAAVLDEGQVPFTIYNYPPLENKDTEDNSFKDKLSDDLPFGINLIHINPQEMMRAYMALDTRLWDDRYNIAFWLWEIEDFPDQWKILFDYLDEIWTPSEFVSNAIQAKTTLPVYTIPYCVTVPVDKECNRAYFGLPSDLFLFLAMYDSASIAERKNPQGIIEAYKKAFSPKDKGVGLVIKVNHATTKELESLKAQLVEYEHVYLLTEMLEKAQANSLIQCVDVVVSLHRGEGFGLVLAEAMMLGVPTIATNWSANTEFMNSQVACMVDYQLVTLKKDIFPYEKGQRWAEANIQQAAEYMKRLFNDASYYENIKETAQSYIVDKLSMNQAVEKVNTRINKIYQAESEKP